MKSYNDGVISIYNPKENLNSFSAKVNEKELKDFDFIMDLFFKEESKRQQDIIFANSLDRKLTFKIKVPYTEKLKINYKAIYKNVLYDIFFIDPSKDKKEVFIYMEEVRKIGI